MKRFADELRDLTRLVLAAVVVLTAWVVVLGMRPGVIPFGEDARAFDWVAWTELLRVDGDLSRWTYRATFIGGARVLETIGALPFAGVATTLHLSAANAMFVSVYLSQTMLAFLGVSAVSALLRSWEVPELTKWQVAATAITCAFTPLAGLRLSAGHLGIADGFLAFAAPAALLLVLRAKQTPSMVLLVIVAWSIRNVLASGMQQQLVLYSALFGGLILIPIAIKARLSLPALLAVAAGVVLALPIFLVLLAAARGDDAARSLAGAPVTWSWSTSTPRDWATLFTAGTDLFRARPDAPWEVHETQVPLGLALLGLVAVPWRRERGLAWSMAIGLLVVILFAMRIEPVASLVRVVKPLGAFRVPARAVVPFGVMATFLAAGAVVARRGPRADARGQQKEQKEEQREQQKEQQKEQEQEQLGKGRIVALAGVAVIAAMVILPGAAGEAVALVTMVAVALAWKYTPRWFGPVALAVASLAAVSRVLPPPTHESAVLAQIEAVGPNSAATAHALDRVIVDRPSIAGLNGFAAYRMPSPFGYWYPTRRRIATHAAVHHVELMPTQHDFTPTEGAFGASTRAIALLYNVRAWLHYDPRDRTQTSYVLPTAGPAWYADPACERGTVEVLATPDDGQRIHLGVSSPGSCVVVVATNYTTGHRATISDVSLPTLPVRGTLLGVVVPAGAYTLKLHHIVPIARWGWIGWLLLAAACVLTLRQRTRAEEPSAR